MVWSGAIEGEAVFARTTDPAGTCVCLPEYTEGEAAPERLGRGVWERCQELGCPGFTLVAFSVRNWDDDLSPWEAPPIFRNGDSFGGKAQAQLALLEEKMLSQAEAGLGLHPKSYALAGYSMAGLFATWAAFRTKRFGRIASASGSLWFPGFADYVAAHEPCGSLERAYFSLGDREAKTRNPAMRSVEEATRAIEEGFRERGIETTFELNSGNHFQKSDLRMARGIRWVLEDTHEDA